jgi:hypothetical protein
MKRYLLFIFLMLPLFVYGAECTIMAKVQNVQIKDCGQRELEALGPSNEVLSSERYEEIPVGLERFWSRFCDCTMWQVTGIAGAHTRVARVYKEDSKGGLVTVPGGEVSSEIGLMSRFETNNGLFIETQDADAGGRHPSRKLYKFDGSKFVALRRASMEERNR